VGVVVVFGAWDGETVVLLELDVDGLEELVEQSAYDVFPHMPVQLSTVRHTSVALSHSRVYSEHPLGGAQVSRLMLRKAGSPPNGSLP